MRNFSLVSIPLLLAATGFAQTWSDQGSTSLLSNVSPATCANTTPPSYCAGIIFDYAGNFPGVMTAWSSAVARTKRGSEQLLVYGGGHVSTLDNSVYSYNLNVSPVTVSALTTPSLPNATASPATNANVTCTSPNADGTPLSFHTYGQLAYLPVADKMFFWEDGAGNYCATAASRFFWLFDPVAKTWNNTMPTGVAGFDINAGSDSSLGAFCSLDNSFSLTTDETVICEWGNNDMLVRYDATANTIAKLTPFASAIYPQSGTSAIDPIRKIFVMMGNSQFNGSGTLMFIKVDISNSSYNFTDISATLKGCSAFAASTYPGIEYDPYSQNFMAYPGVGNTVYEINPDTGVCQPFTASGGPTTSVGQGTFGHWRYFPTLGKFVSVTAVGSDAYTFQMPYSGLGSSTYTCVDRDGDGYGTGPGCLGIDADDLDAAVHTSAQAITKWGSLSALLLHLGYSPTRTWYIATTGNDSTCVSGGAPVGIGSPCLTFAVPNANLIAGDAVIYRGGTYNTVGGVISLTVPGSSGSPVSILGYPGESVVLDMTSVSTYAAQLLDMSYVTIDGFKLTSTNTETECILGGTSSYGLSANTFHNISIKHIDAGQCGLWGIIVAGFDSLNISDSLWHDQNGSGQHGIYIGAKGNALSSNVTIQRNIAYNNYYTGIQVNGNVTGMVEDQNLSYGNVIASYSWENGIHNSTFTSNAAYGWQQSGGLDMSVYDGNEGLNICGAGGTSLCTCTPPNLGSTCAHDQTGNLIENFTAYGTSTGTNGLSAQNSLPLIVGRQSTCTTATCLAANLGSNTFRNIVAVANTDGSGAYMPIVFPDASTGWPQSSTFNSMVLWNNDSTHSPNVFGYGPGSPSGTMGYVCASPPSGVTLTNCVNADPKFVSVSPTYNPLTYNLNLQPGSPALGSGTVTNLPTFDLIGNLFGSTPNSGAFAGSMSVITSLPPWGGSTVGGGKDVFNPTLAPFDVMITPTNTQADIVYTPPSGFSGTCSIQLADMARSVIVSMGSQSGTTVTINTVTPHGLLTGAIIWMENTGVTLWNGWQTITVVAPSQFTYTVGTSSSSTSTTGDAGVLVDDVNPALFTNSDQDSRSGNIIGSTSRTFIVGLRSAPLANDGTRHSRALQTNARHHMDLTCGSVVVDQEFTTANIPLGDTYNQSAPQVDSSMPGQYSSPTVQWPNQAQALIDPTTGIRSYRATGPGNTLAAAANFTDSFTPGGGWSNASVPPTNGSPATFSGTGGPLYLRASTFTLPGGATYSTFGSGSSLDSLTATVNAFCTTGSCTITPCWTINSSTCASTPLSAWSPTNTISSHVFGTQGVMDLWQPAGTQVPFSRADVSLASGTVNFTLSTKIVTFVSGNEFSANWTTGSTITISGTAYTIASTQGPLSLTLVSGPGSNLSGVAYSAPNFGVLLTCTGLCTVGTVTYIAGSSDQQGFPADSKNSSSPIVTLDGTSNGKPGYDVLIGPEIYWMATDGSQVIDMGGNYLLYNGTTILSAQGCATSTSNASNQGFYAWDPDVVNYPDTLYCLGESYGDPTRQSIFKIQYNTTGTSNPIHSAHIAYTPGVAIPACTTLYPVPCLIVTLMQPLAAQTVSQGGTAFNPDYATSGFTPTYYFFGGTSPEGQLAAYNYGNAQDTPGWWFVYDLGNRQPMGVSGGMTQIAAASTYRKAPASWCTIHDFVGISGGYAKVINNPTYLGVQGAYAMTLSSPSLPATGLDPCPTNPFGVTGNQCNTITISGQPVSTGSPSTIQNVQQGDLMIIGSIGSGETVKILTVPTGGGLTFVIQRAASGGTVVAHSPGAAITMTCGALNYTGTAFNTLTNFIDDPLGANSNWTTVAPDALLAGGHSYLGGGLPNPPVTAAYENSPQFIPATLCPSPNAGCQQVRNGYFLADSSSQRAISINPTFFGVRGSGDPNNVDSHPGPCFLGWCMDARPPDGATGVSLTFSLISGKTDLWKATGTSLNTRILPTFAYVGKRALVDVSGPTSTIVDGTTDNYQYCHVSVVGECVSGSTVGDVYVNAPFVTAGTCPYPGIAQQANDTYDICVGDLGAFTGSITQWGYAISDLTGASQRRLGSNYNQWTQFNVFWSSQAIPSGLVNVTNVPWFNGVRTDDLINIMPPYPQVDGVDRSTYLPESVTTTAPTGLGVTQAYVEFGYAENGTSTNYFCTSRGEICVADAASIGATPFWFESTESGSIAPIACSSTCTIAIPAISRRALYYRWKYLNSGGSVVSTGAQNVMVTQ